MSDTVTNDDHDTRHDDLEYDPAVQPPKKSKAWLNRLLEAEDAFEAWNDHCDKIDRLYASLEQLSMSSTSRMTRDREFNMFWANCEVIKPSIYAQAPVPVVAPKFKDRRPVYQQASEVMERCCNVAFDLARINDLMLLVRDDLALTGRGVPWCRYESKGEGHFETERVAIDFKARRDFLHSLSANWREVTWVAAASSLTRSEARKRFRKHSGDAYQDADYKVNRDAKEVGGTDNRERAVFWEIWNKHDKKVLWVAHGCEDILDEGDPHLELANYFPCPKPAYGTLQRGSLVPVPDVMQYKDQLDEINALTAKIHALSDALEVKGFYPAGGGELAEAVQAAVETHSSGRVLVPIANWASFGGTKEIVVWMPIDEIAKTITALVMLRKQIIEDIYQITGMADIMRGDTDPNETLGAQKLKNQYGTTRIRDKQQELVRVARDLVEICSEIITEKFDDETMIEMSQTQLPTKDMIQDQIRDMKKETQDAIDMAEQQLQQMPPEQQQQAIPQIQQAIQQANAEMEQLRQEVTIDQVLTFLRDSRAKAFVLDIETDSTIMADEDGEKQRRTEFVGVLSQLLPQITQMITGAPETAPFCGEVLKFATAPFRAGRSLDGAIDDLIELMKDKGEGPRPDDPQTAQGKIALQVEQMKQQTEMQKAQMHAQIEQAKLKQADMHKQWELANQRQIAQMKQSGDAQDAQVDMAVQSQKAQESRESHQAHMAENAQKMQLEQQKAGLQMQQHAAKQQDMAARGAERAEAHRMKQMQPQPGGV